MSIKSVLSLTFVVLLIFTISSSVDAFKKLPMNGSMFGKRGTSIGEFIVNLNKQSRRNISAFQQNTNQLYKKLFKQCAKFATVSGSAKTITSTRSQSCWHSWRLGNCEMDHLKAKHSNHISLITFLCWANFKNPKKEIKELFTATDQLLKRAKSFIANFHGFY